MSDDKGEFDGARGAYLIRLDSVGFDRTTPDGATGQILEALSVALLPATLTCLAGRSGSGKTTALQLAAGVLMPTRGTVSWQGIVVSDLAESERTARRAGFIGFLAQGGGLVSGLNALENVLLPAVPGGVKKTDISRAHDLLEELGVATRARNFPGQLSGGEQVRVGLARALFTKAPVLLIDEPTAGLDALAADAVARQLASLAAPGRALCIASHDRRILELADTTVTLE